MTKSREALISLLVLVLTGHALWDAANMLSSSSRISGLNHRRRIDPACDVPQRCLLEADQADFGIYTLNEAVFLTIPTMSTRSTSRKSASTTSNHGRIAQLDLLRPNRGGTAGAGVVGR